ncbi:BUD13 homolog isoform X2 [Acropora muricata]|uniref:BUD13 homolog isoform X2 n=1 Tax=Acropora muricata TaxID=159855 RepID=UPI0034E5529E
MQILSTHWTCPQIAGANLGGLCPNYKRKTSHSTSGQGHARKQTKSDSDQSPPRKQSSSDSDQSPPRKRSNCDSDQSPPRKHNQSGMRSSKKLGSESRMSTRLKAGLLTASDLKRENERKQTEEVEMYSKMDRSISGKVSETVYRDKMGRIKDIKMDKVKSREQERKEIEDIKKFMEWGRGKTTVRRSRPAPQQIQYQARVLMGWSGLLQWIRDETIRNAGKQSGYADPSLQMEL